jgi:hypothetical protein
VPKRSKTGVGLVASPASAGHWKTAFPQYRSSTVCTPSSDVLTLYPLATSAAVGVRFLTSYRGGSQPRFSLAYMTTAPWIWRRLDAHVVRTAGSRAFFRLGSRIAISSAVIPMTRGVAVH